jgi:hypothetical protein
MLTYEPPVKEQSSQDAPFFGSGSFMRWLGVP